MPCPPAPGSADLAVLFALHGYGMLAIGFFMFVARGRYGELPAGATTEELTQV